MSESKCWNCELRPANPVDGLCNSCANHAIAEMEQEAVEEEMPKKNDPATLMENALKVIVLDSAIRTWLLENDPKALEQAAGALNAHIGPERMMAEVLSRIDTFDCPHCNACPFRDNCILPPDERAERLADAARDAERAAGWDPNP